MQGKSAEILQTMAQNPTGRDDDKRVQRRINPWQDAVEAFATSAEYARIMAEREAQERAWRESQHAQEVTEDSVLAQALSDAAPTLTKEDVMACIDYFFDKLSGCEFVQDRYSRGWRLVSQ